MSVRLRAAVPAVMLQAQRAAVALDMGQRAREQGENVVWDERVRRAMGLADALGIGAAGRRGPDGEAA